MYYTETVSLRLPQDLLTALDHRRGDVPRGTYIRLLIGTHLDTHPHPDPVVPPLDPPIPTPIQPPAPPDPPVETRHLHRYPDRETASKCTGCGRNRLENMR